MRGLGCALFVTLATAKAGALAVAWPQDAAAWLVLFADDAALALAFAACMCRAPRWCQLGAYAALAAYAAANAACVRALGTPLVVPMLRGADAAMHDSVARYLELDYLLPAAVVLAVALLAPCATRRLPARVHASAAFAGLALTLLACAVPVAHSAHRSALVALVRSALPRDWSAQAPVARPAAEVAPAPAATALARLHACMRGRSVVVVVLESAAARFLRPYGAALDPMPFLTTLAPRSLLCSAAWAVYPESIKGQLALWHSVAPAPDTSPQQHGRVPVPGLARLLSAHGYRSGLFHAGRFAFLGMREVIGAAGFDTLVDAATISGQTESSFGVDEESTVAATLAFVDTLPAEQPFLAAYLPIAGHHPYASPPGGPFPRRDELGCYRNALHYADRALRLLWEGLCARRPPQSLLLCVVGDHGQAFGEHDGNFGHTFALFEENLHVPLLFCAPGATDDGFSCTHPVSHLDVAPTLLALLGLPPHAQHQGQSLLTGAPRPVFAFTDWGEALVAMRDGDWKYVFDLGAQRDLLFDLRRDPGEATNEAARAPHQTAAYRARATAWVSACRRAAAAW